MDSTQPYMYATADSSNPYGMSARGVYESSAGAGGVPVRPANGAAYGGYGAPSPVPPPAGLGLPAGLAPSLGAGAPGPEEKEEDYVYFVRNTNNISKTTLEAARSAKMRLEHAYRLAVDQAVERSRRCVDILTQTCRAREAAHAARRWRACARGEKSAVPCAARSPRDELPPPAAYAAGPVRLPHGQGDRQRLLWRGACRAEERYRENLCDEDAAQERNVQKGPARACACGARCACRVQLAVGRAALLLLPGLGVPVPLDGVFARRRSDDDAHQVRHLLRGRDAVLHCRVRARAGRHPPAWFHPSVRFWTNPAM